MRPSLFERYGAQCAVIAAALIPFKLTLGYIGLIPLVVLWLISNCCSLKDKIFDTIPEVRPFILFLCIAALTSFFGINVFGSISRFGTLFFFPLVILAFHDLTAKHGRVIMSALLCGQTLACFNAIMKNAYPTYAPKFLGPVSQSGHITLILFLGLGLYFSRYATGKDVLKNLNFRHLFLGLATTFFAILLGFSNALKLTGYQTGAVLVAIAGCVYLSLAHIRKEPRDLHPIHSSLLATLLLPMITAALLVNLKRGPWAGILVGVILFCSLHAKRLVLPLLLATCLLAGAISPIQKRILSSEAHFFISGGRNAIWQIGGELALKYPLGIGFENSGFLRSFSSEIPDNLKHFHNNVLNVAVETGWLGALLYLIAFYTIIKGAFCPNLNGERKILASALGCGLIAWQVAGFVEYNFGDAAVVAVAYMMIGFLYGIKKERINEDALPAPSFQYQIQS